MHGRESQRSKLEFEFCQSSRCWTNIAASLLRPWKIVLVPWTACRFQCWNINIFFELNTRKRFYQTALGNCYGIKLPKCWLQSKNNFIVLLVIIFGTSAFSWARLHFSQPNPTDVRYRLDSSSMHLNLMSLQNTNRKSYIASQTQPSTSYSDELKCQKRLLTYLLLIVTIEVDGLCSRQLWMPISCQCRSSVFLNVLIVGASTTSCGSLFHSLTIRKLKKFCLTVVRHFGLNNFTEWCPLSPLVTSASSKYLL